MTRAEFKRRARAVFEKGNPDAVTVSYTWEWRHGPEAVTWADGSPGWSGTVAVAAGGHRPRIMTATVIDGDEMGVWVR